MGWKRNLLIRLYDHGLLRFDPLHFVRTYIYPLTVRGTRRVYRADRFAESYYRSATGDDFSDRITIAPDVPPTHARYHYNATENSIIRAIARHPVCEAPVVLDIGSGAGHWIDFWRENYGASEVVGLELAESCARALAGKYRDAPGVRIVRGDLSDAGLALGRTFDVINAIGVIFHIVDDDRWRQALANMRALLNDTGVIVVGGYFGLLTRDTQFHLTDEFDRLETSVDIRRVHAAREVYVNKRVRSLRLWKSAAADAGLEVRMLVRTAWCPEIATPENNILLLTKRDL